MSDEITITAAETNNKAAFHFAGEASIGQPRDMLSAEARVAGTTPFALNAVMPGMVHAAIVRSPVAHAEIESIDVRAAERLTGVVGVLTAKDFDSPGAPMRHFGPVINDQPIVCGERVRYAGDPVAIVAAESTDIARRAALLVDVDYRELPRIVSISDARDPDASLVHEFPPRPNQRGGYADIKLHGRSGNICTKFQVRKGNVEDAFSQADHVIEDVYHSPAVDHVTMEPHVVLATWSPDGLDVTTSSQAPYAVRDTLAELFNFAASQVRVVVPPIGGGYGGKTYAKLEPITAALSWKCGRPVKLVLSREEEFLTTTKHAAEIYMRSAFMNDGTVIGRDVSVYFNCGAYADISPRLIKNASYSMVGPYDIANVRIDSYAIYTNQVPAGAYRGYGVSQAAWAYESQMDQIADALDMDSLELRRRNLLHAGKAFVTGETMAEAEYEKLLDMAAEAISWTENPRMVTDDNRVRAKGLAVILKSTITPSSSQASVKLNDDGSLSVLTSSVEMGQGAHTVLAQIAAETLAVDVSQVTVSTPDTTYTPYDQTTSSSRTTRAMGGAVAKATREVRDSLFEKAALKLGVTVDKLVLNNGKVQLRDTPGSGLAIAELMSELGLGSIVGDGAVITAGGLNPETGQGIASDHWHQGSAGVELEIDFSTGKIYLIKVYAAALAGRVINPKLAKLQMHGSMIFGIGHALYEELHFEDGELTNPNLSDYTIPTMEDIPEQFEIGLIEEHGPATVHGLGETALPPVIAAIGNAVARATGNRVRTLPITPERVLNSMEDAYA